MSSCKLCSGSRHVFVDGGWKPCSCLKKKKAIERYRRAGIPARFIDETWSSFLESYSVTNGSKRALIEQAKMLKDGRPMEPWLVIHGHPASGRVIASTMLLKAACDAGLDSFATDIPTLIDAMFDREPEYVPDQINTLAFLVVTVGNEPKHSYNSYALEKLLQTRWARNLSTVLVSEIDASRLHGSYGSAIVGEMLTRNFKEVWIGPKGNCGTAK